MGCLVLLPLVEMPYILFIYLDGGRRGLAEKFYILPTDFERCGSTAREGWADAFNGGDFENNVLLKHRNT